MLLSGGTVDDAMQSISGLTSAAAAVDEDDDDDDDDTTSYRCLRTLSEGAY